MKSTYAILLIVLFGSTCVSQVTLPAPNQKKKFDHSIFGLGVSAGFASGFGISFRQHLPSEISYQVVAGIIKTGNDVHYDLGGEIQYDIIRAGETRFYICGGTGYFYSGSSGTNDLSGPYRIGGGIGGEWRNTESFHLGGGLVFTYFSDGTVLPLPELGAHYYFY